MRVHLIFTFTSLLLYCGCSSDGNSDGPGKGKGGSGGSGGSGTGTVAGSPGKPPNVGGGPGRTGPMFAGAECPSDLGLSDVFGLPNVKAEVDGSNVRITFDPQGDAKDYRVYALPSADQISGDTVKDAVYRCAGGYAVPSPAMDDSKTPENPGIRTKVAADVGGFKRTVEDATLGYVFTTPGDDRVPVYVLGDPHVGADNITCYEMRWPESRVKHYTTSEEERSALLAKHWRDDGIAFYAPKSDVAGTVPITNFKAADAKEWVGSFWVKPGAEYDHRAGQSLESAEGFSVYTETKDGAEPLLRVSYGLTCGRGHDELSAGVARFNKAFAQGAQPVSELHFSGLTEETTLVVEALDELCPFQGILAPTSRPARQDPFMGFTIDYPAFQTPEQLAAASETGELFVNGQGSGTATKPIARACVKVKPETPPAADFRYDGTAETYSEGSYVNFQIWNTESPTFDVQFHTVATDQWSVGSLFGELWVTYADWAADTNGKMRITPKARATIAADSFVHATMEVDTVSTQRRYPQLLIGDVEVPVQDNLTDGSTVVIQMFGGINMPLTLQMEFCDHRTWDVNNQCPGYDLTVIKDSAGDFLSPRVEINGLQGNDRTVRFDAYVSTKRAYLYTNGVPYGCVDLPPDRMKAGPGTVTFGDVLYHSGVDLEKWYPFHKEQMQVVTSRHYSNLAFSSNTPAPTWDESRLPCVPASGLK